MTRHGLTRCRRLHRDVYISPSAPLTRVTMARAAALWAGTGAVLAGLSAAALHGSRWIDDALPQEVLRGGSGRATPGIIVRSDALRPDEITTLRGLPCTSAARTGFDLGRWLRGDRAIEAIDALCNATGLDPARILEIADGHPGARRIRELRRIISLVDSGAASPQETRTRLLIVRAGLPPPQTQLLIRDKIGLIVARADLGWERRRVLVEYDGAQHWLDRGQRTRDIDRYQELEELGWACVRVDANLLHRRPEVVLARIHAKLVAAGAPV